MWNIWKGPNAKWFQTCTTSNDVTMALTTWNFRESVQKIIELGTMYPDSIDHCYKVP